MENSLKETALQFYKSPVPGKISVTLTKSLITSKDLALTCSPGVAAPHMEIHADPQNAYKYTAKGNLVAVISNGIAVLGLDNIGALAGKPVIEGEGVLLKRFAGVDVPDIETDEKDPQKLMDIIASLEPTLGGTNFEGIKTPECSYVERELRKRCKIPVFHGDQHGTTIITTAAVLNALCYTGCKIEEVAPVCSDVGVVAIVRLNQLLDLGLKCENVTVYDSKGVICKTREDKDRVDESKQLCVTEDNGQCVLADVVKGKDILLSLSGVSLLTPEMLSTTNEKPIVFAMVNPNPEILPPLAKETRSDVVIGTGRLDFPNQVNNVSCFPLIFRGALDIGMTTINEEMKRTCVYAPADLAMEEVTEEMAAAYGKKSEFGAEYLISTPFDSRLLFRVATATTEAAMESGVATCPIADLDVYAAKLAGLKL